MGKANYRKIIQLGKTTYCVSLPKSWLEKHGVEKGDTVLLDTKPRGHLIIAPDAKSQIYEKEITINANTKSLEEMKRNIISAYINDYTKIRIIGKDVIKKLTDIRKNLEVLSATEIMHVEKDKIIIKSFFDANPKSVQNVLTRLNMLILSQFGSIKNILAYDIKDYEFLDYEKEINKLCFMGFRVLNHALDNSQRSYILGKYEKGFLSTWVMLEKLERVADRLHAIGQILKESDNLNKSQKQCKKKIFELISNTEKEHKTVLPSFYHNDHKVAQSIIDICKENSVICNNEIAKHHDKHAVLIFNLLDMINMSTSHIGMMIIDRISDSEI